MKIYCSYQSFFHFYNGNLQGIQKTTPSIKHWQSVRNKAFLGRIDDEEVFVLHDSVVRKCKHLSCMILLYENANIER